MANPTVNSLTGMQKQTADTILVRRGYSQPKLIEYGDVRALTEGGQGSLQEGMTPAGMIAPMRHP